MKSELRKRKKRFWGFCLALMLLMGSIIPMTTFATAYDADVVFTEGTIVSGGDSIKFMYDTELYDGSAVIQYFDYGQPYTPYFYITAGDIKTNLDGEGKHTHTVLPYSGTELAADEFKEWKVTSVSRSGGKIQTIQLTAVAEIWSDITYELDGGTNGAGNPDKYCEGVGVASLADASKSGFTFDGWYADAAFNMPVTSIPAVAVGDLVLYAKFTQNVPNVYAINYELDGGTNGSGNPATYTEGVGVASFADASKSGYTFNGWYADAGFTTPVTSISTTQTGNVALYAKFVQIPINDDDTTVPAAPTTTPPKLDTVPKTGDEGPGMVMFAVALLSGAAVVFMKHKQKNERG
ncbi:MAG: InlB B-repeat-containing protein [Lachnospiraceae bacterium]|nr:InlB B-repeat-containing protein [Lachnospiraceae bacterium]